MIPKTQNRTRKMVRKPTLSDDELEFRRAAERTQPHDVSRTDVQSAVRLVRSGCKGGLGENGAGHRQQLRRFGRLGYQRLEQVSIEQMLCGSEYGSIRR